MSELITSSEAVEFEFQEEEFSIIYEDGVWFAKSLDEEEDQLIIQDKKSSIINNEDIELFNGFILTVEHFQKLKNITGDI